ncbi:hypothetical protein [Nocardia sp. XZ_19_385]|uniref:LppU/SCO3897 family protein n=1 Tax=Nocardia sp. XZ_19_385 TaxID=2769488 RepID=UPI002814A441|nr:hypothetical protein [Nocardia sp. XZ_19_385]
MRFPGALLAVAAIAVAVTGCSDDASKSDVAGTKVGDCINITDNAPNASKGEAIDCSAPKAVYKVFQTFDKDTACAQGYTRFSQPAANGGTAFMCLAPNFKQDSCYNEVGSAPYKWAECGSKEATIKVVKRIDGSADEFQCSGNSNFITIADPKTVFCLGKP